MKNLYIIGYGLAGGYGGIHDYEIIKAESFIDAELYAWQKACDYYEMYIDGTNLRSVECIMEEEDLDEEAAYVIFDDERESWLEYVTIQYNEENMKKIEGYNVYNPYKKLK